MRIGQSYDIILYILTPELFLKAITTETKNYK